MNELSGLGGLPLATSFASWSWLDYSSTMESRSSEQEAVYQRQQNRGAEIAMVVVLAACVLLAGQAIGLPPASSGTLAGLAFCIILLFVTRWCGCKRCREARVTVGQAVLLAITLATAAWTWAMSPPLPHAAAVALLWLPNAILWAYFLGPWRPFWHHGSGEHGTRAAQTEKDKEMKG